MTYRETASELLTWLDQYRDEGDLTALVRLETALRAAHEAGIRKGYAAAIEDAAKAVEDIEHDYWDEGVRHSTPCYTSREVIRALSPAPATPAPREQFFCPDCGGGVYVDEDGCCTTCGADTKVMPAPSPPSAGEYKCRSCGTEINEGEAKTFTCCEVCWDKTYPKPAPAKPDSADEAHVTPCCGKDGDCLACLRWHLATVTDERDRYEMKLYAPAKPSPVAADERKPTAPPGGWTCPDCHRYDELSKRTALLERVADEARRVFDWMERTGAAPIGDKYNLELALAALDAPAGDGKEKGE